MTDLAELKRLAGAATSGPWFVSGPLSPEECGMAAGVGAKVVGPDDTDADPWERPVEVCDCGPFGWGPGEKDATFIAAMNPAAVLELIERIEVAEKALLIAVQGAYTAELRDSGMAEEVLTPIDEFWVSLYKDSARTALNLPPEEPK